MAHRKLDAVDLMEDEDAFVDETGGSGLAPEDISARKAQVSAHLSRYFASRMHYMYL